MRLGQRSGERVTSVTKARVSDPENASHASRNAGRVTRSDACDAFSMWWPSRARVTRARTAINPETRHMRHPRPKRVTELEDPMTTQALYRFFNTNGELLYVGITLDPGHRWKQHRADKPWWHEVTQVTIQTYPDRITVRAAELQAIQEEHPAYNIAGRSQNFERVLVGPVLPESGEPPRIHLLEVKLSQGVYGAKVRCPYCSGIHHHGLGTDGTDGGLRTSDCRPGGPYYLIVEAQPR